MIIRITDQSGQVAYIDNDGQVNGAVRIQGDTPLVSHLNRVLNSRLDVPFGAQKKAIDPKFKIEKGKLTMIYKASDVYMREHFIPVECTMFGYSAEILKG